MLPEIIPAILPKNELDLEDKVRNLPSEVEYFHFDVLEEDIWTEFNRDFEAHLMVKDPEAIMGKWVGRGARRIVVHSLGGRTAKFEHNCEIGLGVELNVPLESIYPFLEYVDFVQLMSIAEIGKQGHPFDEKIFDRIKEVREKFPNLPISVDGGINPENYQKLIEAGANRLIVGSKFNEVWNSLKKS